MTTTTRSSAKDVPGVPETIALRDWFAGQAAAAMLTSGKWEASILADHAYRTADALLAQRSKP